MALPFEIDQAAFDALPEPVREHYQTGTEAGKFVLDCPGAVAKKVHDTFRTENISLRQKVEAYGTVTPDIALDLFSKKEEIEAAKSKVGDKVNELVDQRVGAMKTAHENALKAATDTAKKYRDELETRIIDGGLIEAGAEFGLLPGAHEDVRFRGRQVFKLGEDGKTLQAVDPDGNPRYTTTGEAMTPKAYMAELSKTASHLFAPSQGGGSQGNAGKPSPTGGDANPWKKESFNLTKQGAIFKENPAKAKELAAQAGVTLD